MIDTKRLATDAAYWNEVAPEGATHFDPHDGAEAPWIRVTGDEYEAKGRGAWVPDHSGPFYKDAYIPRPTKPAEVRPMDDNCLAARIWPGTLSPPTPWRK